MTFVRLPHRDIITDSPSLLFNISTDVNDKITSSEEIGAADRYRDWE